MYHFYAMHDPWVSQLQASQVVSLRTYYYCTVHFLNYRGVTWWLCGRNNALRGNRRAAPHTKHVSGCVVALPWRLLLKWACVRAVNLHEAVSRTQRYV